MLGEKKAKHSKIIPFMLFTFCQIQKVGKGEMVGWGEGRKKKGRGESESSLRVQGWVRWKGVFDWAESLNVLRGIFSHLDCLDL
jgi:hypothetical protein